MQYNAKPFDFNGLLDIQRKNMEAFTEAGRLALDGFQTVMQRQTEIIVRLAEDTSSILQEAAKDGTVSEKAGRHSDLLQNTYEKSIKNWHELAGIIGRSGREASDVVHERITSSLTELKSALHKSNGKEGQHKKAA